MAKQNELNRREFLAQLRNAAIGSGLACAGAGGLSALGLALDGMFHPAQARALNAAERNLLKTAPLARYWVAADSDQSSCMSCHDQELRPTDKPHHHRGLVKCLLCARNCSISQGETGWCGARANDGGALKSLVYGRPITIQVDPIEKKPFYHFLPGASSFSLATSGCPLTCAFCQNWAISQARPGDYPADMTPAAAIVQAALDRRSPVIAFTYNEPTVFAEYLLDIAIEARRQRLRSVLISCGYMNEKPLEDMCDALDAIKIDLKGFSRSFYADVCKAELEPVLRSMKQIARRKVHLEIVNLVVPTLNDSRSMLTELCKWVLNELGPDIPVHFSRFHPAWRMQNLPPTPQATLEDAYHIAKTIGLRYPYVGNVPGHAGNHTYCHHCGKIVIRRVGFFITEMSLTQGCCKHCHTPIAGVYA